MGGAIVRATRSRLPPAANGTTIVMGFAGICAVLVVAVNAAAIPNAYRKFLRIMLSPTQVDVRVQSSA